MSNLSKRIDQLEREKQIEFSQPHLIYEKENKVISGQNMADLHRLTYQQGLGIPTLPLLAEARIDSSGKLREFLWRYNWMSSSVLSHIEHEGKGYSVFTHINPFRTEENRIQAYERSLGKSAVQLNEEDIQYILSMEDGKKVIVIPFEDIRNSPRGVISLSDIVRGKGHSVALGAFGNDRKLLDAYIKRYVQIMEKCPFTPTEIGIWFSEDAKLSTMRPLEIGDSGIGIYARNLTNKEYRTLAFKK